CILVRVKLSVGTHKGFLSHVLGLAGVAQHAVGHIEDGVLVFFDEARKRLLVAGQGSPDKRHVLQHLCRANSAGASGYPSYTFHAYRASDGFSSDGSGPACSHHLVPPSCAAATFRVSGSPSSQAR